MPESILAHQESVEAVPEGDAEQEELAGDSRALGQQLVNVTSPGVRRSLALVGGVIVLSVIIGVIVHYRKSAVVDTPHPDQQTTNGETPKPRVSNLPPDNPRPPVGTEAEGLSDQKKATTDVTRPKQPKKQAGKPVEQGTFGFLPQDIPFLLRKAAADAGAGRYDDARREYNIVRQFDPNNAIAKEGLRKLELLNRR